MVFIIVGGVAVVVAASLWNLLRRRIPDLTQDDLLEDPTNDLQVVRKLTEEDRAGMREAFKTSEDFIWILKDGDELQEEDADDMAAATSYLVDFMIWIGENYGYIIKSADKDGKFQGAMIIFPPIPSFRFTACMVAGLPKMGLPPSAIWNDAGRKARLFAYADDAERYHHEAMKDCINDHWMLLLIGVAPSAQGKRVGTRLLQQVFHLAGDKPLYLDCHNGNVPYYEKNGFKCAKNYAFQPAKDTSKSTLFYFNSMRRDPQ